jgi:hypothetical protein
MGRWHITFVKYLSTTATTICVDKATYKEVSVYRFLNADQSSKYGGTMLPKM